MGGFYINKALTKEDPSHQGLEELCPTFANLMKGTLPYFNTIVSTSYARTVFPPISSPAWGSILSGLTPEQTGMQGNEWPCDHGDQSLPLYSSPHNLSIPRTIFDYVPNAPHTGIVSWSWLGKKLTGFLPNVATVQCDGKDDMVVAEFEKYIDGLSSPVDHTASNSNGGSLTTPIAFLHFDDIDHAGHQHSWGSEAYYGSWKAQDDKLAAVLNMVKDKSAAVVVISDHGGSGNGHGFMNTSHMLIPIILATTATSPPVVATDEGKAVGGSDRMCPISCIDVVPTLLQLLGREDSDPTLRGKALAVYAPDLRGSNQFQ
eukprot:GILI01031059.1.p1 GENE.GILI01031059.1~~GILI01031059.1.p1  ORF type:complete len:351 (-),score=37.48 GILI01031059.1:15-965(-)